jgi:hypothetical protein
MVHRTESPHSTTSRRSSGSLGTLLELRPGEQIQLLDAPIALRLAAVVADSRAPDDPSTGRCTVRLSVVPERGEVSTFYLSLEPDAPELASVSAFGYRVTLHEVTPGPAQDGVLPHGDRAAKLTIERHVERFGDSPNP